MTINIRTFTPCHHPATPFEARDPSGSSPAVRCVSSGGSEPPRGRCEPQLGKGPPIADWRAAPTGSRAVQHRLFSQHTLQPKAGEACAMASFDAGSLTGTPPCGPSVPTFQVRHSALNTPGGALQPWALRGRRFCGRRSSLRRSWLLAASQGPRPPRLGNIRTGPA